MKLRPKPLEETYGSLCFDIESDGFIEHLTRIHCLVIRELETNRQWVFRHNRRENNIAEGVAILERAAVVIGHNILAFDLKAIKKLFPDFELRGKIRDTLVMARLIFANVKEKDYRLFAAGKLPGSLIGTHGLESYGYRLGMQKGTYQSDMEAKGLDPWQSWNQLLEEYCELDVDVNCLLYDNLVKENFTSESIIFEHQIHDLMVLQHDCGIHFDVEAAEKLADDIEKESLELQTIAIKHFGIWYAPAKKKIVRMLWNDEAGINAKKQYALPDYDLGEDKKRAVWGVVQRPKKTMKYKDKPWTIADVPFTPIVRKEFKPTSRTQIIDRFTMVYGWTPTDFTEKGNPEVNDEVLQNLIGHIPMAKELAEIFYLEKRIGQIKTGANAWLKLQVNGKIHHTVHVGGTVSGRCSHARPNLAQVPRVVSKKVVDPKTGEKKSVILKGREGKHGWDCRSLFYVPEEWGMLVGCDLSGVELRCLAEATWEFDEGYLADIILNGDIHEVNREKAGLDSRDQAKTFIYACCTMDTMALTPWGWKTYDELVVGELILTYNQKDNVKEWKPVLEKVKYNNAEVIELRNKNGFVTKSTPNHRWFINQRRQIGSARYLTQDVRTTEELNTESSIIVNASMRENRDLAPYSIPDYNLISKRGTNWVDKVLQMNQSEMNAFMSGFMIADGYYQVKSENSGGWNWNQNVGNLQEAALLASYMSHYGHINVTTYNSKTNTMMKVGLNSKQHVTMQTMTKTELENQDVWCVRTENESWVIRQGNTITITGNTIYGAGDEKIGSIVAPLADSDTQRELGKALRLRFMNGMPGLKKAIKTIQKQAKKGFLIGRDGRKLYVRGLHSAPNLALQHDGAMIAKLWVMLVVAAFEEEGWECGWEEGQYVLQLFVHDEIQVAVKHEHVERAKVIMKECAAQAGKIWGFRVPIDAEAKSGHDWSETH